MDNKVKSIIIYDNINDLNKLKLETSNEIIQFNLNDNPKEFLKLNDKYQTDNKFLIYFVYHKDYNSIRRFARPSDIYIYYKSSSDIDLYNCFLDNYEFLNNE